MSVICQLLFQKQKETSNTEKLIEFCSFELIKRENSYITTYSARF